MKSTDIAHLIPNKHEHKEPVTVPSTMYNVQLTWMKG